MSTLPGEAQDIGFQPSGVDAPAMAGDTSQAAGAPAADLSPAVVPVAAPRPAAPAPRPISIAEPIDTPKGFYVTPGAHDVDHGSDSPIERPSWSSTFSAAFSQSNDIVSTLQSDAIHAPNYKEPDFSPWEMIKGTPYEASWSRFVDTENRNRATAIMRDIDQEKEDKRTVDAAGWRGTVASFIAGTLDLPLLIPGGAFVSSAKGGVSILRSGVSVALGAAAGAAIQEAGLQATQQTRTGEESAMNIGASAFLGGLLGMGGAKLMSHGEWNTAVAGLERDFAKASEVPAAVPAGAGAEAAAKPELEGLSIAGSAASKVAAATKNLNPVLRLLQSPSAVVRDESTKLFENPVYLKQNFEGVASAPAVETLAKEWNGGLAKSVQATDQLFSDYRKAGGALNSEEFRKEVGKAMRRGDASDIPEVAAAAKQWRQNTFDPLKQAAIEAKLLPEDVSVDTAESYFSRLWNRNVLTSEEPAFKNIVQEYYEKKMGQEFGESLAAHEQRISRIDQELSDIRLSPEDRLAESAKIDERLSYIDSINPQVADAADRISDLTSQMIAARTAKDTGKVASLKAQIDAEREAGGDVLKGFIAERGALRTRKRNVEFGQAGLQERSDEILSRLADLAEANQNSMQRLIKKGQLLERDLDKLDEAKLADRMASLRESFVSLHRRTDAAAERARKGIERVKSDATSRLNRLNAEAEKTSVNAKFGNPEEAAANSLAAKTARETADEVAKSRDAAIIKKLEAEVEVQSRRASELDAISNRLSIAEQFDREAAIAEVRAGVARLVKEVSDISLSRGAKSQRLIDRLKSLDPQRVEARAKMLAEMKAQQESSFYTRWEAERGADRIDPASRTANFKDVSRQIADEVFDTLTGRVGDGMRPEFITIQSRGPMKERTFHIPDALVEKFLEHDVDLVGRRYSRVMAADVELARKFGSPDMKEPIQRIRDHYREMREQAKTPAELQKLDKAERADIRDITGVRDLIRGTYQPHVWEQNFAKIVRNANYLNYLRTMGEVVIASLPDAIMPAVRHGLLPYMSGLGQVATNLKAVKMSVQEAKLAGNVMERILAHRLASMAEMTEPYSARGPIEAFLHNATNVASKWNGIRIWTDTMKSFASVMSQNRILQNVTNFSKAKAADKAYLAHLGIDESMAERIAKQFAEHGENLEGVHVAGTEEWTDPVAKRVYRAALNKDMDSTIVQPGVGDVPLLAHTPIWKSVLQFKSFALASHQRVVLRGLQEDHARMMGRLVAMATVGMMATYLKALSGNRLEKLPSMAENPGWWIGEGIDRSGFLGPIMDVANAAEKLVGANPIKAPIRAFDQGGTESEKVANRGKLGALLGPSVGLVEDTATALGVPVSTIKGDDLKQAQKNAGERLLPFNSYMGMRQMLRYVVNPQH